MRQADVIGHVFGRLTVRSEAERLNGKSRRVVCRCECGVEKTVLLGHLRSGATQSCGCLAREIARRNRRKHGLFAGHACVPNEARTRLYTIWMNIHQRCRNPQNPSYRYYGARGIAVCDQWADFGAFRAWALTNGYSPELTIDRVDNDGPYAPENCRWATHSQQRRNRPDVYRIPIGGQVLTLTEASKALGVSARRLRSAVRQHGPSRAVRVISQEARS